MADLEDYLQEGFDPRSVTIPRLRSILVTHNIEYPSAAKKPQLVQLVAEQVLPQAPKLRAQRARAKRSSLGIVNAGSEEDNGRWDDSDLISSSTTKRASRSPRKSSTRIKVEEEEAVAAPSRGSTRRASRPSRAFEQPAEDDGGEEEILRGSRRSRRTVTPQIKVESEELLEPKEEEDSVFTDDNPFQSGSSPPSRKTSGGRRRATGDDLVVEKSPRRQADVVAESRTSRSFEVPMPRLRTKTPEALLEPGEEFTPDEQLELEEAASKGEVSVVPRQSSHLATRKRSFKTPLAVLLLSLLCAYGAWYRQEKIAVGYCGLGRPATQILPPDITLPEFLAPFIEPQCEQCPPHAYCYEDFSVTCEPDFVLQPHPLSFAGLVPLPPTCEPDSEKARRVQSVADKAVEELRDRRAKFECGDLVDDQGQQQDSPAIAEEELKEVVSKKRSRRLNSAEFDDLWAAAIGEVTNREEVDVETTQSPPSTTERQVPNSKSASSRPPLSLAFRSPARPSARSDTDWQDIDSRLGF